MYRRTPCFFAWQGTLAVLLCISNASTPASASFHSDPNPAKPQGTVAAVYALLDRVLPGSASHFRLVIGACPGGALPPCYHLGDDNDDNGGARVAVTGTGASELSAAVGYYFRQYCNMTLGWPRGGGSNVFLPSPWPRIGVAGGDTKRRAVPWSYMMNVVTHSYSFAWYVILSDLSDLAE